MTNEELVEEIQKGINVQANMQQLYDQNERLIKSIIKPYLACGEAEDMKQAAYIGLHEAAMKYKTRGAFFVSYAKWRIRAAVVDCITDSMDMAMDYRVFRMMNKVGEYIQQFLLEHGRCPDDEEICEGLKISENVLCKTRALKFERKRVSLDSPIKEQDGALFGELIPDDYDLENSVIYQESEDHEQDAEELWQQVQRLPQKQADVIRKRFMSNVTYRCIADEYGLSHVRVMEIEKQGLKKLHESSEVQQIALNYGVHPVAWRGGVNRFRNTMTSSTEEAALWAVEKEQEAKKSAAYYKQIKEQLSLKFQKSETDFLDCLKELPERERDVIHKHVGLGIPYKRIGNEYGLTKTQMIRVERSGLKKLMDATQQTEKGGDSIGLLNQVVRTAD